MSRATSVHLLFVSTVVLLALSGGATAGNNVVIPPGGDLQAAINGAVAGDVITLAFRGDEPQAAAQRRQAAEILQATSLINDLRESDGRLVVTASHGGRALPQIMRLLDEADIYVDDLTLTHPTLDDVFLKYTGEHIREEVPLQHWRNQRGPFGRGPWGARRRRGNGRR